MHMDLEQRKVVVVGGGRSGVGAARLLASRHADVTLVEEQGSVPEASALRALGVSVVEGALTGDLTREAALLVLSPGVPAQHALAEAARARGVPVIGELELAWRHLDGPVVAVTGTKGKSTTTTLIGRMLSAAGRDVRVGGNIGIALSVQVMDAPAGAWHVIEASSFQLETIERFRPDIAVWLNFSVDHLDRHGTEETYASAKARIFENQTAADWAVIPGGDERIEACASRGRARIRRFGPPARVRVGVTATDEAIVLRDEDGGEHPLVPLASIELKGEHMLTNVMAACAAADLAGVSSEAMRSGVEGFTGLEHVLEPVGTTGGVHFYNDSKATNVDAALKAIEAFDSRVVVILGGVYKGGDFAVIADALERRGGEAVVIGASADRITRALAGRVPVTRAVSMDLAVRTAFERAAGNGVVLLAPACSSFDMFRDYAERGRQFKAAVAQLATADHGGGATDER